MSPFVLVFSPWEINYILTESPQLFEKQGCRKPTIFDPSNCNFPLVISGQAVAQANLALKKRSCAYQRCWRCHPGWALIRATFHWPCIAPTPSPVVGGRSRKSRKKLQGSGNLWTPATAVKWWWLLPGPCVTGLYELTFFFCWPVRTKRLFACGKPKGRLTFDGKLAPILGG